MPYQSLLFQEKVKRQLSFNWDWKTDHIWYKPRRGKNFTILDVMSGYHHVSIHPGSRSKTTFICPYGKFQGNWIAFSVQIAPSVFLNLMFEIFFKYLDNLLVLWMDDLLIYSQTAEENLKHIHLVFEKLWGTEIKLKMSRCEFLKSKIEYLGHLVSGQGISPMKQMVQSMMDLLPATNITKVCYMISSISYYRKFFPAFRDIMLPLNKLTKKNVPLKWTKQCQKSLDYVKQVITSSHNWYNLTLINNITCSLLVANTHGVEIW